MISSRTSSCGGKTCGGAAPADVSFLWAARPKRIGGESGGIIKNYARNGMGALLVFSPVPVHGNWSTACSCGFPWTGQQAGVCQALAGALRTGDYRVQGQGWDQNKQQHKRRVNQNVCPIQKRLGSDRVSGVDPPGVLLQGRVSGPPISPRISPRGSTTSSSWSGVYSAAFAGSSPEYFK